MSHPPPPIATTLQLAIDHHRAGRSALAEELYHQILAQDENHADALYLLGVLRGQAGDYRTAVDLIRRALAIQPNSPVGWSNLGAFLQRDGQIAEAIECLKRCLTLQPRHLEALNNLGLALHANGQLDEAIQSFQKALELAPGAADLHGNLAITFKEQGRLDEAIASFRHAIAAAPAAERWHSFLLVTLLLHSGYDARAIYEENVRWRQQHADALSIQVPKFQHDRSPERRLKIGYVSADFCDHASAFFLHPLLKDHDHANFEIHCFAQVSRPDALTQRFRELSDHWHFTVGLSDADLADLIRREQIDILVDLKLHTANHRLLVFARKPAPIQVTWLGFPGTTGLNTIDYRFTDPYLDPPGLDDACYSEKSVRLPDTFWCYDPLTTEPPVNALPASTGRPVTFGCLNNFCKINDDVLQLWARVLQAVPKARLLLQAREGSHRRHVLEVVGQGGIDPGRIEFAARIPRPDYLRLYHQIDIGLDTWPYNGHTTSLDSFWMGVPVVTKVGRTAVGRAVLSQLTNLGLPELAARTPDDFIRIATTLAQDLPRLANLRAGLRQRMEQSPLMDAPRFVRAIEHAYREMWHKWCAASSAAP